LDYQVFSFLFTIINTYIKNSIVNKKWFLVAIILSLNKNIMKPWLKFKKVFILWFDNYINIFFLWILGNYKNALEILYQALNIDKNNFKIRK
jgi:hypothetical protein